MLYVKNDHHMHNRLKTTAMGLGLVRLLMDSRRAEEAKATLALLENDFQGDEQREVATARPCGGRQGIGALPNFLVSG